MPGDNNSSNASGGWASVLSDPSIWGAILGFIDRSRNPDGITMVSTPEEKEIFRRQMDFVDYDPTRHYASGLLDQMIRNTAGNRPQLQFQSEALRGQSSIANRPMPLNFEGLPRPWETNQRTSGPGGGGVTPDPPTVGDNPAMPDSPTKPIYKPDLGDVTGGGRGSQGWMGEGGTTGAGGGRGQNGPPMRNMTPEEWRRITNGAADVLRRLGITQTIQWLARNGVFGSAAAMVMRLIQASHNNKGPGVNGDDSDQPGTGPIGRGTGVNGGIGNFVDGLNNAGGYVMWP